MEHEKLQIVILGFGNLGYHFCKALGDQGHSPIQIYNRSKVECPGVPQVNNLEEVTPDADVYLLCVSDGALPDISKALAVKNLKQRAVVAHCSGASPLAVLEQYFPHCGVCWPLQSFSKSIQVAFSKVTVGVQTSNQHTREVLVSLMQKLGATIQLLNEQQRAELHLAAVLVNNFSNALFSLAQKRLEKQALPFDLLRPLINETASKIQETDPSSVQTGPAIRNDQVTLQRHLDLIKDDAELTQLYRLFTKIINPGADTP